MSRTRIIAIVYITIQILSILAWSFPPLSWRQGGGTFGYEFVWMMQVVSVCVVLLWICLLMRKPLAWWLLTLYLVLGTVLSLSALGVGVLLYVAGLMIAGGLLLYWMEVAQSYTATVGLLVLLYLIPLWVLLTDKPNDWASVRVT